MIVHAEWSQQQEQQIDGKHVKNDIGLAIKIAKGLFYWIHLLPSSKIWLAEHDFPKKICSTISFYNWRGYFNNSTNLKQEKT